MPSQKSFALLDNSSGKLAFGRVDDRIVSVIQSALCFLERGLRSFKALHTSSEVQEYLGLEVMENLEGV